MKIEKFRKYNAMVCSSFNELRERCIPRYYFESPSKLKFVDLMISDNVDTIQRLAAYIFHAVSFRKDVEENIYLFFNWLFLSFHDHDY